MSRESLIHRRTLNSDFNLSKLFPSQEFPKTVTGVSENLSWADNSELVMLCLQGICPKRGQTADEATISRIRRKLSHSVRIMRQLK